MKKYRCRFNGRTKNAIGVFYPIEVMIEAESFQEAHYKLYDDYEHLHGLVIFEVLNDNSESLVYSSI